MKHVMKFHCSAKLLSKNESFFKKFGVCLLVMIALLMPPQFLYADYCLKTKPPKGMPKRCHSMMITVPSTKSQLRIKIVKKMATCVQKSRANSLVTQSNFESIWERISSYKGKKFTLVPNYTPFTFKKRGNKCYGIQTVEFKVTDNNKRVVKDRNVEKSIKPTESHEKESGDEVIDSLKKEIESSNNRRKNRLICMISKIEQGGDDRVIGWENIAPKNETPVPIGVRRRAVLSKGVDTLWLKNNIRSVDDVNAQHPSPWPIKNEFVRSLKEYLLFTPSGANLFTLSSVHDDLADTPVMLELWANVAANGGSSSMPPEYRALHAWARGVMNDKNSVLNCLKTSSAK